MKLQELQKLMKDNNINGVSHLNKPEIIQRLIEYCWDRRYLNLRLSILP